MSTLEDRVTRLEQLAGLCQPKSNDPDLDIALEQFHKRTGIKWCTAASAPEKFRGKILSYLTVTADGIKEEGENFSHLWLNKRAAIDSFICEYERRTTFFKTIYWLHWPELVTIKIWDSDYYNIFSRSHVSE